MKHFEQNILQDKLQKIQEKQTYILDEVENYKLVYCHYPTKPENDCFEFFGVPHGKNVFPELLFTEKTLSSILQKMKEYSPSMKSTDWETYQVLSKKATEATHTRCISNNEITRNKEDKAVQELCDFCQKHKIEI